MCDYQEYLNYLCAPYSLPKVKLTRGHKFEHNVLMISPHPDDESINASFALRLKDALQASIYNYPLTYGSNKERQIARKEELKNACHLLGFKNLETNSSLQQQLNGLRPKVIIIPHAHDNHPTHQRTHQDAMTALKESELSACLVIEWEYWSQLSKPNLILEIPQEHVNTMMKAVECHRGEVVRNPYHLRLPAWLIDNARRGQELILEKSDTNKFVFANLFRAYYYRRSSEIELLPHLKISVFDDLIQNLDLL